MTRAKDMQEDEFEAKACGNFWDFLFETFRLTFKKFIFKYIPLKALKALKGT